MVLLSSCKASVLFNIQVKMLANKVGSLPFYLNMSISRDYVVLKLVFMPSFQTVLGLFDCSGFSLVVASRAALAGVFRLSSLQWLISLQSTASRGPGFPVLVTHGLSFTAPGPLKHRLHSCGPRDQLLCVWDLPGSGIKTCKSPAPGRWILYH